MDLKILDKKKNELLKRTELTAEMHEKTIPSKQVIREKLSAMLNTPVETIVITQIKSKLETILCADFSKQKKTIKNYIMDREGHIENILL